MSVTLPSAAPEQSAAAKSSSLPAGEGVEMSGRVRKKARRAGAPVVAEVAVTCENSAILGDKACRQATNGTRVVGREKVVRSRP